MPLVNYPILVTVLILELDSEAPGLFAICLVSSTATNAAMRRRAMYRNSTRGEQGPEIEIMVISRGWKRNFISGLGFKGASIFVHVGCFFHIK